MPTWVVRAISAARRIPWAKVIAVIVWLNTKGREYWDRLTPDERREVRDLAIKSKGQRSNLTGAEQDRVVTLLMKIRRGPDAPADG